MLLEVMMSIALSQILALVGKLDDTVGEETPRERFRRYLADNVKEVGEIRDYIGECLLKSGDAYNRALQDLINHIGRFLGFEVVFGRYQGVVNQIGFDGHWISPNGFHIVVEVKTSDAYTIKTKTLVGYVDDLISAKKIPNWDAAMGLYVVGRPDANLQQLDNAIIAEKRTDQLRILSVESLLALADMESVYDVSHSDILALLRPSGPRIDPVVNLITTLLAAGPASAGDSTQALTPSLAAVSTPPMIAESKAVLGVAAPEEPVLSEQPVVYWLTPVKSNEVESAEQCIQKLVGTEGIYAFGHHTPGRKHIKPGDWICFYATTKGVIAHARVATVPENRPNPKVNDPEQFPWVFSVDSQILYLDTPVIVDGELRSQLDAFQGKDLYQSWAWFVQATHKVTEHDFQLLTLSSK
jgi:hypothetical protein